MRLCVMDTYMKQVAASLSAAGFPTSYVTGTLMMMGCPFDCYAQSYKSNDKFVFCNKVFTSKSTVKRGVEAVIASLPRALKNLEARKNRKAMEALEASLRAGIKFSKEVMVRWDDYSNMFKVGFEHADTDQVRKALDILNRLLEDPEAFDEVTAEADLTPPWFATADQRVINIWFDTCNESERHEYCMWRDSVKDTRPMSTPIWREQDCGEVISDYEFEDSLTRTLPQFI